MTGDRFSTKQPLDVKDMSGEIGKANGQLIYSVLFSLLQIECWQHINEHRSTSEMPNKNNNWIAMNTGVKPWPN